MRKLLIYAVLGVVAACSNVPTSQKLDPTKRVGLAVGTITYETSNGKYTLLAGRPWVGLANRLEVGQSNWNPLSTPFDKELKAYGSTYSVELPEGEYRLIGWQWERGASTRSSTTPFSIPFKIEQGKATYLGNAHFNAAWELSLQDRAQRDLPLLQTRFAALATTPIAFAIAEGTDIQKIGDTYVDRQKAPTFNPIIITVIRR
jgi:hypothetical protein